MKKMNRRRILQLGPAVVGAIAAGTILTGEFVDAPVKPRLQTPREIVDSIMLSIASRNIQNPHYSQIKRILENATGLMEPKVIFLEERPKPPHIWCDLNEGHSDVHVSLDGNAVRYWHGAAIHSKVING